MKCIVYVAPKKKNSANRYHWSTVKRIPHRSYFNTDSYLNFSPYSENEIGFAMFVIV